MANLIFGANLGSEILYNNQEYILIGTNTYLRNEITSLGNNDKNIINKIIPTYSYNNNGIEEDYQYPAGAEMASYKYGWKYQEIQCENPVFSHENWISPTGILFIPKHITKAYSKGDYGRYNITEYYSRQSWTAPADGILRMVAGVIGSYDVRNPSSEDVLGIRINYGKDIITLPKVIGNDTVETKEYIWINNEPYSINKRSIHQSLANANSKSGFNDNAWPVPLKKGDTISFMPTYIVIQVPLKTPADEYNFEETEFQWFMNGIFYPYEP